MAVRDSDFRTTIDVRQLDPIAIVHLCAEDTTDSVVWTEFLHRFGGRIRGFIRGTFRQLAGSADAEWCSMSIGEAEETDLLQNTILRLVDNDCAALRRFSGRSERDLLAYFAVISRSVVRDCLRQRRAQRRPPAEKVSSVDLAKIGAGNAGPSGDGHWAEREVLKRELAQLSLRVIRNQPARDQLIFDLYFTHDLTASEIAGCRSIGLTKRGVESVLDRLKVRVQGAAGVRSSQTVEQ